MFPDGAGYRGDTGKERRVKSWQPALKEWRGGLISLKKLANLTISTFHSVAPYDQVAIR